MRVGVQVSETAFALGCVPTTPHGGRRAFALHHLYGGVHVIDGNSYVVQSLTVILEVLLIVVGALG
jgi:hypothetical protein